MNYHEFNLLITPNLEEEQVKDFNDNLIKELKNIKLISEINSSKKSLSYQIEGENTAWLSYFNITIAGDNKKEILDEAEKLLKDKKEILRYLILAKKEIIEKPKRRSREAKEAGEEKPVEETKKEIPEKINIEKVNEKVEELLKEE